jgi:hypothetical protein
LHLENPQCEINRLRTKRAARQESPSLCCQPLTFVNPISATVGLVVIRGIQLDKRVPRLAELSLDIGKVLAVFAGGVGMLQGALDIDECVNCNLNFLPLFGGHILIVSCEFWLGSGAGLV